MGAGAGGEDARRARSPRGEGVAGGGRVGGVGGRVGGVGGVGGGGPVGDAGLGGSGAARPFAALVYNPTKVDVRRLRPQVEKVEAERGWGPSLWAETTLDDSGEGHARRLLAQEPSVLIAVGGDGTVSAVAQALVGPDARPSSSRAPSQSRSSSSQTSSQTPSRQDARRPLAAACTMSTAGAAGAAGTAGAAEMASDRDDDTLDTAAQTRVSESAASVPLGILPTGTTNLFARALGLPLRSRTKALRAAFSDAVRTVDIGRVDASLESGAEISRAFLVMAGMGVDAQMVVNTSTRGKNALGWTGYIAAIVGSFVSNRRFELTYALDGVAAEAAPAHTIVLGNAGVLPAGIRMIPGARIDDGELDVVVLRPLGFAQWAQAVTWFVRTNTPALPRRAAGRAAADGSAPVVSVAVTHSRATSVTLSAGPAQDFEIDGEHLGRVVSAEAWIDAAALRVRGSVAP